MLCPRFRDCSDEGGARVLSLDTFQKRERGEKNSPLYDALKAWLGQSVPWAHQAHLTTCLWMVVVPIQRGEVSLTRWLPYVPCRGVQAQRKQRRLSRWLHHSCLNIHRVCQPLIQGALAGWAKDGLYLSLDTALL